MDAVTVCTPFSAAGVQPESAICSPTAIAAPSVCANVTVAVAPVPVRPAGVSAYAGDMGHAMSCWPQLSSVQFFALIAVAAVVGVTPVPVP